MEEKKVFCFFCQKSSLFSGSLSFRANCEHCGEDLHICKNCSFYDESAYNECKESSVEKVKEKERNNVCEYFRPLKETSPNSVSSKDLLKQAEELFKKK